MVDNKTRICPYCSKTISKKAVVCRYCNRDVPPATKKATENSAEDFGTKKWNVYGIYSTIEIVKDGFSWPAFFFPPVWLIVKRLWWIVFGYLIFFILMKGIVGELAEENFQLALIVGLLADIPIRLLFGFYGNRIYSGKLRREGFIKYATIMANNKKSAIAKYKK